ncbi:MAG: endonuclease/exonuclease/phosphatase family protein [Clostridia bacterium]|nr:endonuclease/exonuclease/phosphatase family protein [Clostridia bacterium]
MKLLKRLLIALLILSMLCVPFAACKKQGEPSGTEASTEASAGDDNPLAEPILLCDTKQSYYRVVRPASSPEPVSDAVTAIMGYPAENGAKTMKLSWGSDKSAATDAEILVGLTNRPESLAVLQTLDHDDFAIRLQNGKIVIAAHTPERITQAAEYFCKNLLQIRTGKSGQKELVYLGDYTYTGAPSYLFNKQDELKDYVIVYPKDSETLKKTAENFQKHVKENFGVDLSVVDDTAPETACEFLVGNVNRPLAKEYLEKEEAKQHLVCMTVVKEKKVLFGSLTDNLVNFLAENFCKKYMLPQYSFLIQVPASLEEIGEAYHFADSTALAEGADMRVMSFNILCELFDELAVIEGRQIPVIAPIFTYKPDILGLQEMSEAWYPELDSLFGSTYAFVDRTNDKGDYNSSPLVYNTETMTLLEHGTKALPLVGSGSNRTISWGYFERKSDGARFVAVSTHWNPGSDEEDKNARVTQAGEMATFVKTLKSKYNCPIITAGDYNSRLSEDPIKTYISKSGLKDACQNAKVVNRSIKTTHTLFNENNRGPGEAIDHVFASDEIELLFYNVLIDKCLAPSSDHYPVYADIKLTK